MMLAIHDIHRDDSALAAPRYVTGLRNATYHALPGLSSSVLRDISAGCVADVWHRRVTAGAPSPAMMLGTSCHTLVLEPEHWQRDIAVLPDDAPKSGKRRDQMVRAALDAGAEAVVTSDEAHTALCVALAVQDHPTCRALLADCPAREPSLTWRHESGHVLRVRPDALGGRLVDLKTSAPQSGPSHNARSWRSHVLRYGMHISAAMYRDVVREVAGYDPGPMVWIVASTKAPHTVGVYKCGEELERAGRALYHSAIERYDTWYRSAVESGSAWAGPEAQIETIDIRGAQ